MLAARSPPPTSPGSDGAAVASRRPGDGAGMHRVFVYGTLKRGFTNHEAGLAGAAYLGRFRTREPYPLVVGGKWLSPYLIAEPGVGERVFGEVFEVSDKDLAALDRFEGAHLPEGYRRIAVAVEDAHGATCEAWTYVKDRAAIDGIRSEPMAEYQFDPRYVIRRRRTTPF
jgi:gamma-glutamylaminecyclotransferase